MNPVTEALHLASRSMVQLTIRYNQIIPLLEALGHSNLAKDLEEGLALLDHGLVHLNTVGFSIKELLAMPLEIDAAHKTVKSVSRQAAQTRTRFNNLMYFGAMLQARKEYAQLVWIDYVAWVICVKPTDRLKKDNLSDLFGPNIQPENPNAHPLPWLPVHVYWEVGRPRKMCWLPDETATHARIPVVPRLPFVNLLHGPEERESMVETTVTA